MKLEELTKWIASLHEHFAELNNSQFECSEFLRSINEAKSSESALGLLVQRNSILAFDLHLRFTSTFITFNLKLKSILRRTLTSRVPKRLNEALSCSRLQFAILA